MKFNLSKLIKSAVVMLVGISLFTACNKDEVDPIPLAPETPTASQTIAQLLDAPNFSLLKEAATKAGLLQALGDASAVYTIFAPDNDAFQLSGITSAHIAALSAEQLRAILQYHIVGGQRVRGASIPASFPNLQLPTQLVLAPPSASLPPGLRMSIFPSTWGNSFWVNNIPLTQMNVEASNGVLHHVAAIVAPPTALLWNRIDTDPNLTYLKAAIRRADEGAAPGAGLQAALLNPAANLTVFAPSNAAFQQILTAQITGALMAQGVPPATAQAQATFLASTPGVFTNPALASVLTPTTMQGLIAYHVLGSRAFSVNLPINATASPTLLNRGIANHPGVMLQAVYGPRGVTSATVKGTANPTASNVLINPAPGGTSDQHYVNGVLHVIDQVLRPQ